MQFLALILCITLGFVFARFAGIHDLQSTYWYVPLITTLLAAGLYASTYGISLKEARQHLRLILSAVTVGVFLKAAIIGGSLALIFKDPFFLILGVVVAQIDPLSVAGLMKKDRLSSKAKTILACWASFDDPITVTLALYAPLIVAYITKTHVAGANGMGTGVGGSVKELGGNIVFAAVTFIVWQMLRRYIRKVRAATTSFLNVVMCALLVVSLFFSVVYFLMLGVALIGLFLRPSGIDTVIDRVIVWVLRAATFLMGFLIIGGVAIWKGLALGVAAYCSQIIVGWLLTRSLLPRDRWHISFAQQNGITAIILALLFEPVHHGTVAIVAPAVFTINCLHAVANKAVDVYILHESQ